MEAKIKMMAASVKALSFLRKNSNSTDSEVLQFIAEYILNENIKDYPTKFSMIAAANETYKIFIENPKLSDKEILKKVMLKLPEIHKKVY